MNVHTFGPSTGYGTLFNKLDASRSGLGGGGATVVGGDGVVTGSNVPNCRRQLK